MRTLLLGGMGWSDAHQAATATCALLVTFAGAALLRWLA